MKKVILRRISLLFFSFLIFSCHNIKVSHDQKAQKSEVAEITISELRQHIAFLASDSLKGRKPGTDGSRIAAEYIAEEI